MGKPTFMGVGGHKCASTWLSECLREHPDVFVSNPKEIGFFRNHFHKGLDWYLKFFDGSHRNSAIGEFTSYYLYNEEALERAYSFFPDLKIIISVREPVGRSLSQIKHGIRNGTLDFSSKEIRLEKLHSMIEVYPEILTRSFYSKGIEKCINLWGKDNVLVFEQSEFQGNPEAYISRLYSFIGVDEDFVPKRIGDFVSKGIVPRSLFLEKFRQYLYRRLKYVRGVVPFIRRTRIAEFYRVLNKSPAPDFDSEASKYLQCAFENDWIKTKEYIEIL